MSPNAAEIRQRSSGSGKSIGVPTLRVYQQRQLICREAYHVRLDAGIIFH
jgi:hypothetical protein